MKTLETYLRVKEAQRRYDSAFSDLVAAWEAYDAAEVEARHRGGLLAYVLRYYRSTA